MPVLNRFGNMTPPLSIQKKPYLCAIEPFKIAGNLYYVGNIANSCHLIDTGKGLIIIDTPPMDQLPYLVNSIWKAGFRLDDLKYIIISHAHVDHYGSVAALVHMTGARSFISEADALDMRQRPDFFEAHNKVFGGRDECFTPTDTLADGDVIELGDTKIKCVLTPGHTVGTMSHFWELKDGGRTRKVGIYGGAGFITLSPQWWNGDMAALGIVRRTFADSIEKVWSEEVDIMLGNHPFHSDILKKRDLAAAGRQDAFVDHSEWRRFLGELKERFEEYCRLSSEEIDNMYSSSQFEFYHQSYRMPESSLR